MGTSGCASICARTAANVPDGSRGLEGASADLERVISFGGVGFLAAATRIEQAANDFHRWCSALQHVMQRRATGKERVCIRELYPAISQSRSIEDIQSLEDADQIRNALQTVLVQNVARVLLQLIIFAVGDAAE